ncbi:rhomboid domain-containing protein 3 isoform X2 [Ambystoma mexicanum]
MKTIRRLLSRACGPDGHPLASVLLMLLLVCLSMMNGCERLRLDPGLIVQNLQVHRLFTYPVCHHETLHLLLDLLLFVLLGWRQERAMGTLRYLQRIALCVIASAVLYLIIAPILTKSPATASGYTAVHLAMLTSHPFPRWKGALGQVVVLAIAWAIILFGTLLIPGSPFLLNTCGVLTGMLYWTRALSWLEVPERKLEELEGASIFQALARNPFLHFVPSSSTEETLPYTDPMAANRFSGPQQSHWPAQGPLSGYFMSSTGMAEAPRDGPILAESWVQHPFFQRDHPTQVQHFPPWLPPSWHSDAPLAVLENSLMEEAMLRAGIQASLDQSGLEADPELKLSKSSVSALRLQQLERMGFPTQKAVVALAATGKVEGAVSLLVGGQVGEEAVVTTDSGAHYAGGHRQPERSTRLQELCHPSAE